MNSNTDNHKIKESPSRRKERLQFSKRLTTKIVESKKTIYKRNKFKEETRYNKNDY